MHRDKQRSDFAQNVYRKYVLKMGKKKLAHFLLSGYNRAYKMYNTSANISAEGIQ